MSDEIIKELTSEERFTWGTCPICQAEHGQRCDGLVGIPLGRSIDGSPPHGGAHLGRLQKAPHKVRLVPVAT